MHKQLIQMTVVAAVLCGALAGCSSGGSDGADSDVASVSAPETKGSKSGQSGSQGSQAGAMVSMTMTEAEKEAIHQAWYACLKSKGAQMFMKGGHEMPAEINTRKPAAAYDGCKAKEPYLDPLYVKEKNPRYAEQTIAWMACMNREGIEVSGNWDDDFFTFGKVRPGITNKAEIHRKCYTESYK